MLTGLQVLRAAAALSVALPHIWNEAGQVYGPSWDIAAALPWNAGVDVFFVISGFVMAYATSFAHEGARRLFLSRRLARIVPLYWLATLAVAALAALRPGAVISADAGPWRVAASLLFLPTPRVDGQVAPVLSLGWTLQYEMFFYLVFAAFVGLPRRGAVAGCAAAMAAIVACGAVLPGLPVALAFWSDPIVLEFAAGLLLGAARAEGLLLGAGARVGSAAAAAVLFGWASSGPLGPAQPLVHLLSAACLVAACGLGRPRPAGNALARAGRGLGDASYALYLLHPFAMRGVHVAVVAASGRFGLPGRASFVLLCLGAAVALALAAHRWVERPLTRLARRALAALPPRLGPVRAA